MLGAIEGAMIVGWLSLAWADCATEVPRDAFLATLTDGDVAVLSSDVASLAAARDAATAQLPCVAVILEPAEVAAWFRLVGISDAGIGRVI